MRKPFILAALALAALAAAAQTRVINGPPTISNFPLNGPAATGASPAGYFNDLFNNAGLNSGSVGSPTGSTNGTIDNGIGFAHPGLWQQSSGTTSGAGVWMAFSVGLGSRPLSGLNAGVWYWEREVQIPVLPGTTAAGYQEGIHQNFTSTVPWTASSLASFQLTSANGVPNDWYCVAGTTATDTAVAATTSWVRLSLYADGTFLHYYINGAEVTACKATQSTLLSGNVVPVSTTISNTTTSVTKFIDYDSFYAVVSR